jgi:general secretion pathway protein I
LNRRRVRRGFTLIEVLIAFAILAVAMTALFQVFSNGLRTIGVAERYTMATMLARSVIDDVGVEIPLVPGERRGEIGDGFSWSVRIARSTAVKPLVDAEELGIPYDVSVTVSWDGGRSLTLTTLRIASQAIAPEEDAGGGPDVEGEEPNQ